MMNYGLMVMILKQKLKQRQIKVDSFFFYESLVHHEYAPTGEKINKELLY